VRQAGRKSRRPGNQKLLLAKREELKKEEEFSPWKWKKISRKKTDFQTATFLPLSSRP
jgi:hypothetical protein